MIAYNTLELDNLSARDQAATAFNKGWLTKEELDQVYGAHPVYFYSPNFFIRIGLFILTFIICLFSFGIFALLFLNVIDKVVEGLAIFFALLAYGVLEYMVQTKKHLQSGVDDALLWISAGCFFGGISFLANAGPLANCTMVFVISLFCTARFADRLMSIVVFLSLVGMLFFLVTTPGNNIKAFIPFIVMAVSLLIYLQVKKLKRLELNQLYAACLEVVSISALLMFYFSGNYYVVRELSIAMFNLDPGSKNPVPFGWLFWIFTFVVPCIYILRAILLKDIVLLRAGLVLVAAIIFTVRYYYAVVSIEVAMTAGGIILMAIAYGLSRYLKVPKYGFTSIETDPAPERAKIIAESLLVAETFGNGQLPPDGTKFGGGSFGGGGASAEF